MIVAFAGTQRVVPPGRSAALTSEGTSPADSRSPLIQSAGSLGASGHGTEPSCRRIGLARLIRPPARQLAGLPDRARVQVTRAHRAEASRWRVRLPHIQGIPADHPTGLTNRAAMVPTDAHRQVAPSGRWRRSTPASHFTGVTNAASVVGTDAYRLEGSRGRYDVFAHGAMGLSPARGFTRLPDCAGVVLARAHRAVATGGSIALARVGGEAAVEMRISRQDRGGCVQAQDQWRVSRAGVSAALSSDSPAPQQAISPDSRTPQEW